MSKISDRLIARLRKEGWISDSSSVKFERCYPGHWQRSAGAWVWMVEGPGVQIGSSYTAKECLKAKELAPGVNGDVTPRS
jgi:hypothetical protein